MKELSCKMFTNYQNQNSLGTAFIPVDVFVLSLTRTKLFLSFDCTSQESRCILTIFVRPRHWYSLKRTCGITILKPFCLTIFKSLEINFFAMSIPRYAVGNFGNGPQKISRPEGLTCYFYCYC